MKLSLSADHNRSLAVDAVIILLSISPLAMVVLLMLGIKNSDPRLRESS